MSVYDSIDRELKNRHLTKKQLAEAIGVPYTSYMSARKRNSTLSLEKLLEISSYLQVPIEDLDKNMKGQYVLIPRKVDPTNPDDVEWMESLLVLDPTFQSIKKNYLWGLNEEGQEVAAQRIEELTHIPKYQYDKYERPDGTIANRD